MRRWRNCCQRGRRCGYALLLGLLITLVVGIVFFYMRMHGPVHQIGVGKSDIEVPWRQWHKIYVRTQKGRPPGRPGELQPQISKALQFTAKPREDTHDRGIINLFILPDGKVQGEWGGQFFIKEKVDFQVMACKFKGLVDPEQVYTDDRGEDPAKLFFIAKGPFVILETNDNSGKVRNVSGHIYVRGWLGLDDSVDGEIILTSDEQNFYLYTWQAKGVKPGFF